MSQRSSIEMQLSKEERADLDKMIASGEWTVLGLTEWLGQRGFEISKSAAHRYMQKIDRAAAKMRESRQITEALTMELGNSATQGKQGRLLVEMVRGLVFDLLDKVQQDDSKNLDTKDVALLGKGLAELSRALRSDQDYETKIREIIAREERLKAADDAVKTMTSAGLTAEQVNFWKESFLGVRKPDDESGP